MLFPLFDHNPTKRLPLLTVLLIVVNVGVFVQGLGLSAAEQRERVVARGFIPKRLSHINDPQPIEVVLTDPARNERHGYRVSVDAPAVYATLLSTMFLHGGWFHVISNMWMLWVFGNNIEDRLGHVTFLGFYTLGGIAGSMAHWLSGPESGTPVIGASGAVWAVLGGYALTYPWAWVKSLLFVGFPLLLEVPALVVIAFYFVADAVMVIAGIGGGQHQAVAHWAHLGGCFAGVTLMPLLAIGASPPESDWRGETESLIRLPEQAE